MKKLILFTFLLASSNIFSQSTSNPVAYMNEISSEFKNIQTATWDYTRSVAKNKSARTVNKNRLELIQTIKNSIAKVKKVGSFNDETYYRDSVLSFLNTNLAVVSEDYEKIMNLEEIAEQSYDLMDAYLKAQSIASDKLSNSGEMVGEIEKRFAKENNITLTEADDKISLKLEKAGKVYDYYNPVYLIFFKSFKQEIYLIDALNKNDVSAMEQNKSSLSKFGNEGLAELALIKGFNGDESLIKACEDILKFYVEEADVHFQKLIDFQTTKEAFEKAKANLESKKEKERTKEDIDNYNKLVGEYNAATKEFNETNKILNDKRSKFINLWNSTSQNFTSKNID